MKILKLFSVLALSAMTLTAVAEQTAKATIKAQADGKTYSKTISLVQETTASTDMASNNEVGPYTGQTSDLSVGLWVAYNEGQFNNAILPNLNNLTITFKANKAHTAYTLSMYDMEGGIKLQRGGVDIELPYQFTCAVSEEITFTVVMPQAETYERDVVAGNWGTICLPKASSAIEGATIYEVLGKEEDNSAIWYKELEGQMEAGMPYLFQASAAKLVVTLDGDAAQEAGVAANGFFGTFEKKDAEAGWYVVKSNMLYMVEGTEVDVRANGAYVNFSEMDIYSPTPGAPARKMMVAPRGAATGMQEVKAMEGTRKAIVNGRLVIIREGRMFNALGGRK